MNLAVAWYLLRVSLSLITFTLIAVLLIPEGIEDHQAKEYETIVVMTEDDYELGTWGMIGVGAAGGLLILSIGIALY